MDIHGVVQDENAYVMGGVAGHAGLFSTARSVHRLVAELVRALRGLPSLFERDLVRLVWTKDTTTPGSSWALGWDTPAVQGSSAGSRISAWAVGHLGFTGTSVWLDLDRGVHVVFLTNRIHEGGDNRSVRELRPRVHDAVFAGLG
jgi:CubicO group peptidase (beta-lactamase class C family)